MRVLVLDGNENQAVASVRSLSRAGHEVHVGASTRWSKAGLSRYRAGRFVYPDPQHDSIAFVQRIAELVANDPGTLVLPMTERTSFPLSLDRDRVREAGGRLVFPAHESVERAFDKRRTVELANQLGIAIPRSFVIESEAEAERIAGELPYPVVVKPSTSEEKVGAAARTTGRPVYARDAAGFRDAYSQLRQRCSSVIAQEFVDGAGAGYFALMCHGELQAEFAHLRLRDVHPTGSGSSLRVSAEIDSRMREAGLAILRALEWHGVAMVEFRVRSDGTPVFLEVNGRFWNSLPLAVHAGADFPALLAEMAEFGSVSAPPSYRIGVRCRWLLGDFRHLLEVLRGPPTGFPGHFPGRLESLVSFVIPRRGTHHDNFVWRDPLPELGDWLDFAVRRLPAHISRSTHSGNPG